MAKREIQGVQLATHGLARVPGQNMRQTLGGRMRAVRSRERVIDVEIAVGREFPKREAKR